MAILAQAPDLLDTDSQTALSSAADVIESGIRSIATHQLYFFVAFTLSALFLFLTSSTQLPVVLHQLLIVFRLICVVVATYSLWSAAIVERSNRNALIATKLDINKQLGR